MAKKKIRREKIDPKDIRLGPIRHDDVDDYVPVLRWQWRHIGHLATWCRSLEDWELGFMRDTNPGREVANWSRGTYALLEYMHKHPSRDEAEVFKAITGALVGAADDGGQSGFALELKQLIQNPHSCLSDLNNFTEDGHLIDGPEHLR